MSLIEIGVVMYDGAQLAAIHGLTDLFLVANRLSDQHGVGATSRLRVSHWQAQEGGGAPVRVFDTGHGLPGDPGVLILPPCLGETPSAVASTGFSPWLRHHHDHGATLCSVCAGAFLLAETGLLADRTITTHWMHGPVFQARFPDVPVDTDRLLIDDGDIVTAGGVMAWTDLGLLLVNRFLGPAVMIDTARLLLIDPPGREQRYYSSFSPPLKHGDPAVLKVQHWLAANRAKPIILSELAAQAGLGERTFLRRFKKATGLTATEYTQRLRINKARELLQFTRQPIENIAWEVGYADPGFFRSIFADIVGLSPGDYRRRFTAQPAERER